MISFEEARSLVAQSSAGPSARIEVSLERALGHVLAEDVVSDTDLPPFDASAMDGFAVRAADLAVAPGALRLAGESKAGQPFAGRLLAGNAVAVTTGAVVPAGADAVVPVEATRRDGDVVQIFEAPRPGQHVRRRGENLRAGDVALQKGRSVRPQEVGLLASLGRTRVPVHPLPRVAILSTGDELVLPDAAPGPGQIRESNSHALAAATRCAGGEPVVLETVKDDPAALRPRIEEGLGRDLLLLTGGVSVGAYDFVARALEDLGVARHFHGVAVKPGKPVWFGTRGETSVFGLPGNPVSAFVLFHALVRIALDRRAGRALGDPFREGVFAGGPVRADKRTQLVPAALEAPARVRALPWSSSGDLVTLARADALLRVEAGRAPAPGEPVRFLEI